MSALQLQSAAGLLLLTALAWALGGFPAERLDPRRGRGDRAAAGACRRAAKPAAAARRLRADRGRGERARDRDQGGDIAGLRLSRRRAAAVPGTLPRRLLHPVLPGAALVLVVGALSSVLYHWGVLPAIVKAMAGVLRRLFGLGGGDRLRRRGQCLRWHGGSAADDPRLAREAHPLRDVRGDDGRARDDQRQHARGLCTHHLAGRAGCGGAAADGLAGLGAGGDPRRAAHDPAGRGRGRDRGRGSASPRSSTTAAWTRWCAGRRTG